MREKRYDAVLHMVTAADGADKYYTLENKARYEKDLDIAKLVDKNLQTAWSGHPHLYIIGNEGDGFDAKIN